MTSRSTGNASRSGRRTRQTSQQSSITSTQSTHGFNLPWPRYRRPADFRSSSGTLHYRQRCGPQRPCTIGPSSLRPELDTTSLWVRRGEAALRGEWGAAARRSRDAAPARKRAADENFRDWRSESQRQQQEPQKQPVRRSGPGHQTTSSAKRGIASGNQHHAFVRNCTSPRRGRAATHRRALARPVAETGRAARGTPREIFSVGAVTSECRSILLKVDLVPSQSPLWFKSPVTCAPRCP